MSTAPPGDPELLGIISSALEMCEQGLDPPIEELCGGRDDLIKVVRKAVNMAGDLPSLQVRASARDPHDSEVLLERYRLDTRIGSGAMGVVYRALDLDLQRSVAVKILRSDSVTAAVAKERFNREAELLAAIRHASVITIYDRGVTERGEQFLVTELLEGISLADLLDEAERKESIPELAGTSWVVDELGGEALPERSYLRTVVRWAADLAGGLSAAHESGVIHRDVKPSNVFIERTGKPLLLDFGIASNSSKITLMRDSSALGTPAYMAPEALSPAVETSPSLDVYGLSVTLYHMLVFRAPYEGSPTQVLAALATKDPTPAYKLRAGLPRDLQAILDKGMARRASERYASVQELEKDLRAFLDHSPVSARPISAVGRALRKLRRSRALLAATGVGLVAVALMLGSKWSAARDSARHEEFMDVWEHVPHGIGLWQPNTRKIVDLEERRAFEELLDRAVALSSHPIPARSTRAAFRFDQGDLAGAAEDMAATASALRTPYANALAESYRAASIHALGDLDLASLPEPLSAMDSYLAAYHAIRFLKSEEDFARAMALLTVNGLEAYAPALELLIPMIERQSSMLPESERSSPRLENYERAVRLEELWGRRTATTAQLIGVALIQQELFGDAVAPLEDGVELCPASYGLQLHLGIAERRHRAGDDAVEHLREAVRMRPMLSAPFLTLARLHLWRAELDLAREVTELAPLAEGNSDRLRLEGDIECAEAVGLHWKGREEESLDAAAVAQDKYTRAIELGADDDFPQRRICTALLAGEEESIFSEILQLMNDEPFHWRRLGLLLNWMPKDLSVDQTHDVNFYLHQLKAALANRTD